VFSFAELDVRIVAAPMAGGPSTPALVCAAASVGAIGFLAAGSKTVEELSRQVDRVRAGTAGPFGVNVFVPGVAGASAVSDALAAYRRELAADAERYGVELSLPRADTTDLWRDKIDYLVRHPVPLVSFTFGLPGAETIDRLHRAGSHVMVTVTDADEAAAAAAEGADSLCVQGPDAGGHRGTHSVGKVPGSLGLVPLADTVRRVSALPLVLAGGIGTADRVVELVRWGAAGVQVGTALLLSPECGASQVYKSALRTRAYPGTTLTRAFSGRLARGLTNRFILDHDATAPAEYPQVNQLTRPLRAAAAAAGDPEAMSLWAGTGFASVREVPAARIVSDLWARL
jgi:nitronate monooxygenase